MIWMKGHYGYICSSSGNTCAALYGHRNFIGVDKLGFYAEANTYHKIVQLIFDRFYVALIIYKTMGLNGARARLRWQSTTPQDKTRHATLAHSLTLNSTLPPYVSASCQAPKIYSRYRRSSSCNKKYDNDDAINSNYKVITVVTQKTATSRSFRQRAVPPSISCTSNKYLHMRISTHLHSKLSDQFLPLCLQRGAAPLHAKINNEINFTGKN